MTSGSVTDASRARFGRRIVAVLAGMMLVAINTVVYLGRPRLVTTFRRRVGHLPNIAEPRSINEKVQWRKVFDRNPLFPVLQDKLRGRAFVAERCPDLALPEILWVGHDPHAIPFDEFEGPVIIKTNHGCGYNYLVPDTRTADRLGIWLFFDRVLSERWGKAHDEWAYDEIRPTLYVERLLLKRDGSPQDDCKINVFAGKAHVYSITCGRHSHRTTVYFDSRDQPIDVSLNNIDTGDVPMPGPLHVRARSIAESLVPELDAIRIDFYIHDGRIWFGEFTIYPGSGFQSYEPKSFGVERARPWNVLNAHYFTRKTLFRRLYRKCLEVRRHEIT